MSAELLRATPFHARTAEANRLNRWENRGGFTLAAAYAEVGRFSEAVTTADRAISLAAARGATGGVA